MTDKRVFIRRLFTDIAPRYDWFNRLVSFGMDRGWRREAVMRGGTGGSTTQALAYVNQLRQRAYGNATGNVATIYTDFFLDERGRELYWEGHRRTDLVRYNKFTEGTYLWPFKGGVKAGTAIPSFRNIFPIPAADLIANPNLKQNTGY